jgi:hypothetical protein
VHFADDEIELRLLHGEDGLVLSGDYQISCTGAGLHVSSSKGESQYVDTIEEAVEWVAREVAKAVGLYEYARNL